MAASLPDVNFDSFMSLNSGSDAPKESKPKSDSGPVSDAEYRKGISKSISDVDASISQLDGIKSAKPPTLTEPPKIDDFKTDPMKKFSSAGMVLATLGSLLTRRPLTHAFEAGGEVNEAINTGDAAKFKAAYENWKSSNDNAWKMAEWDQSNIKDLVQRIKDKEAGADERARLYGVYTTNPSLERAAQFGQVQQYADAHQKSLRDAKTYQEKADIKHDLLVGMIDEHKTQTGKDPSPNEMAQYKLRADKEVEAKASGKASESLGAIDWAALKPEDIVPGTGLTLAAVKQKAEQYDVDASVLTRGGLKQADKEAIVDYNAKMHSEAGDSGRDIAASQAGAKSDLASLTNLTKMADSASAYKNTMLDNMKTVESLMDKGAGTEEGPIVNRWLQAGKKATGDPDVKALDTAIRTVANEYAKIQSGSIGNQALSDSGRAEANELISLYDSPSAIKASFAVLEKDSNNKEKEYNQKAVDIKGRISGKGAKASSEGKRVKVNDPDGAPHTIDESELDDALQHGWSKR